jgi:putative (di)nucleoside polyphosphate hydrolase
MTDWIDAEGFRANVGIILVNDAAQVLMGGRSGGRGWQFPQGGIRLGESVEAALYRELYEELGLSAADVNWLGVTADWIHYRLPPQYRRRFTEPYVIGQKQRWVLLELVADEAKIRFDVSDETPEFETYKWSDYWEPVREVVFFKRKVYRQALLELAPLIRAMPLTPPAWWQAFDGSQRRGVRQSRRRRVRPLGR